MVPYVRNCMINLCDAAQMSCDVAALPFQAHATLKLMSYERVGPSNVLTRSNSISINYWTPPS